MKHVNDFHSVELAEIKMTTIWSERKLDRNIKGISSADRKTLCPETVYGYVTLAGSCLFAYVQ